MKKILNYAVVLFSVLILFSSCSDPVKKYNSTGLKDWAVQSSDSITAKGVLISNKDFNAKGWYASKVPETVLHSLIDNGFYKDIYVDKNLEKVPTEPFRTSWWYRTEFGLNNVANGLLLKINGINYKANVWLNGSLVADTNVVYNSFRQFKFDIRKYVKPGKNVLAIEVIPPRKGDFTLGFVDWAPTPPDKDMGIYREVFIEENDGVSVSDPFIASSLNDDLSQATLRASAVVTNYTDKTKTGKVKLRFDDTELTQKVKLEPGESKKVLFTVSAFPEMKIDNPKLWWPHNLGEPYLHNASVEFISGNSVSDRKDLRFGIRTLSKYFTDKGAVGFKVNGKRVLIKGAGWMDKLLLENTKETLDAEISYAVDAGLNAIRLEGFWGEGHTLYDLCDEKGLMMMIGITCQWEWSHYLGVPTHEKYGGITSARDIMMMSNAFKDQIVWLRNHPSVFSWVGGSDLEPIPELEKKYMEIFEEYDSTRVYLGSAKNTKTKYGGPTGVKMEGPYAYVPPVYWYSDTTKGGAYGFNTETGPGIQLPPLQSLKKMMSEENLWPINDGWNYHCGRFEFGDMHRFTRAMNKRYGKAETLEEYEKKGQVLNYELMRPMFEAFSAYRYKSTGVILWMLNSPWPEMYWQLFDYYLMPNAAYFGAKKANRPYHIIYDYHRKSLFAVNDRLEDKTGCTLEVKVYDVNSGLKFNKELSVDLKANSSKEILSLAELDIPVVYFIDTRLYDETGKEIDNNFYWISPQDDILDYEDDSEAWYVTTPSKQYADFMALNDMPKVDVKGKMLLKKNNGTTIFEVTLENNSDKIAFFVHTDIVDSNTGEVIAPVLWSDNYVSLLPGEIKDLKANIKSDLLKGKNTKLVIDGYNLK
jgi:exo-1,4-beta-D-glucosaminidase